MPGIISLIGPILADGVLRSFIYILIALGITLPYAMGKVVNFAQGALVVLAGLITYTFFNFGYLIAMAVGLIVVILICLTMDQLLFKSVDRNEFSTGIISIGLAFIILTLVNYRWASTGHTVNIVFVDWGLKIVSSQRVNVMLISGIFIFAVYWIIYHTNFGRDFRAIVDNELLAKVAGFNINRYYIPIWIITGTFTAIAGSLFITIQPVAVGSIFPLTITSFTIAVLGGLGNIKGTLVAGLIIGFATSVILRYLPVFSSLFVYILIFLVVAIKPSGIFGESS